MDDESEELEGPEPSEVPVGEVPVGEVPVAETAPALNPRQVRARRRRRRRQFGTLLFVLVAIAIFAAAYFVFAGGGDSSKSTASGGDAQVTTTVTLPFFATYQVTTGVNVRQAPDTTAAPVAVVEQGRNVTVVCAVEGQSVAGASGSSTKWLKVAGSWPLGYVSSVYVRTGDDLTSGKIPACPAS